MFYRKYAPSDVLTPFVECYFIWESEGRLPEPLEVESPPSGFCSIVFNYGDPYVLQNKKYDRLPVPKQFVSGQNLYSYKLTLEGIIGIAGIVFKPAALATIFQLPVYEYTEERVDLYTIFKKDVIDKYIALIRDAGSEKARVKVLDDFVKTEYYLRKPEPDYIDTAANFIIEKNGMLQVTDLLKDSCMSRRTFERKFFQKVGLSPKYFARIRRISYLMNLIAGKKKVDWAAVFHEVEFYDQAHFIKDFEEFTGRTPQQYLKENVELANFVQKSTARPLE
ncbi:MAG TPA: helix-turn-helix domain-containing protein [Chitinophagaceae bacterium]|nr:helix-turn-helix domain-containing protein [Chitinophagaceae bacterium]